MTAVLFTALKNLNVCMQSETHECICFKLGLMIDTSVLYILILVQLIVTLIQGHRCARKQKLLCQLSHTVFNQFKWNWLHCLDLLV